MLFGFGFYIQLTRAQQKGIKFPAVFCKENGIAIPYR